MRIATPMLASSASKRITGMSTAISTAKTTASASKAVKPARNPPTPTAPQIDYLAYHWYDYGLKNQLDRLLKHGKPFWVTEMANWHNGDGAAQIDTVAKQKTQMTEMVKLCEDRADVFRYAWFTGRWDNDTHHTSLLGANGQLTELGQHYVSLPFA